MNDDVIKLRKEAEILFEQEKCIEIIALLTDEVLEQYKDAELYAWRSLAHYILVDDVNKMMLFAQKAIYADPNLFLGYYARGSAWRSRGEFDKAITDYDMTIVLKPDYAQAYNNRGNVWYDKGNFDNAIEDFNEAIDLKPNYAYAYSNRGRTWNSKGDFDKAIIDYNKTIDLKPENFIAYNNRGVARKNKGDLENAIVDYNTAIDLNSDYVIAYNNRGIAWSLKGDFDKAIADYSSAIKLKSDYANAYFNRGNATRIGEKEFPDSIKDFEKFLELTTDKDNTWFKRARGFIEELREKIKDGELKEISELTSKIKKLLLITDGCVTHYTGLSVVKTLILEENNKFRISEGAFLNDTSEGTELFKFMQYQFFSRSSDGLLAETFARKPFIGSFVTESKHDDLNMWRFYGKENGVEAKGCAITLRISEFIDAINLSITKGDEKPDNNREDDINFYRVAYWNHDLDTINFHIPNAEDKEPELNQLMVKLKEEVAKYKTEDKSVLEKYLNNIAFLFKSDAYKNENELRLVIKGIEFDKKFDMDANPPRVYIELVNIRNLIEQITLGPKVDKSDEWAAAIFYSYDKETDETKKPKKILISHLPYK